MKKIKESEESKAKSMKKDKEIQCKKTYKEIRKKEGTQRFVMKECSTCWNDFESGER